MPPVASASYNDFHHAPSPGALAHQDSNAAWNSFGGASAPYRPRPVRQRTKSAFARPDSRFHYDALPHSFPAGLPDYLLTESPQPFRRDSTSSSSHSGSGPSSDIGSSWSSSRFSKGSSGSSSASSFPDHPSLRADTPSALAKLDPLDLPPTFPTLDHLSFEIPPPPGSRSRGISLGRPVRKGTATGTFLDFLDAAAGVSGPPAAHNPFMPLQLESDRARELEAEPPLTLPQPWGLPRESSSHPHPVPAYDLKRTRARSRSPERSFSLPQASDPGLGLSSNIPPEIAKTRFVEGLVGAACIAVEVVWKLPEISSGVQIVNGIPTPSVSPTYKSSEPAGVLPLRNFIKEVLRRSRSTCSTLQTALYYIHKSRDAIRSRVRESEEAKLEISHLRQTGELDYPSPPHDDAFSSGSTSTRAAVLLAKTRDPVLCGRRMFLAALICASKFLQDRTYSNRAWSKISSLPVSEINTNEKAFLELLDYNLFVEADLFKNWARRLQELAEKQERKQAVAQSSSEGFTVPRPSLTREGLPRSASEYLPPPPQTQTVELPKSDLGSMDSRRFPPTPTETPRPPEVLSPSSGGKHTPSAFGSMAGLQRANTDPRFDLSTSERRLPPLGSLTLSGGMARGNRSASLAASANRLPLPSLSVKIPNAYAPPSPSPLSGRPGQKRFASSAMGRDTHMEDVSDSARLPKPALSRRPSGACGNTLAPDRYSWRDGDSMVH